MTYKRATCHDSLRACDPATRVVQDFGINRQRIRFIEPYPEEKMTHHGREQVRKETFDEIFFTWNRNGRASMPTWKPWPKRT